MVENFKSPSFSSVAGSQAYEGSFGRGHNFDAISITKNLLRPLTVSTEASWDHLFTAPVEKVQASLLKNNTRYGLNDDYTTTSNTTNSSFDFISTTLFAHPHTPPLDEFDYQTKYDNGAVGFRRAFDAISLERFDSLPCTTFPDLAYERNFNDGFDQLETESPEAMRTLYFGNLPPDLAIADLLDFIRGGSLDEVKYLAPKNCCFVTFVDASNAAAVYLEYSATPFSIEGYECRVGWGKASGLSLFTRQALVKGASRNVFLGNLEEHMDEQFLHDAFCQFGVIDTVKILSEKKIGFVHLCSIAAAVKAVTALSEDSNWALRRIYYGRDRCCTQTLPPLQLTPLSPEENRTVYIGGIHSEVSCKELCDVIRGGLLQQIKYFNEKNIAFATFVDAASASTFFNRASTEGLVLKSKRMKIGWGKPSQLPVSISIAVAKGASRNVYIGSLDDYVTKESLDDDFNEFGEIELINIVGEKKIGFVSFTDITCAIKAVEFHRSAGRLRVNYGKDRCGNALRPSKSFTSPPSTPDDY